MVQTSKVYIATDAYDIHHPHLKLLKLGLWIFVWTRIHCFADLAFDALLLLWFAALVWNPVEDPFQCIISNNLNLSDALLEETNRHFVIYQYIVLFRVQKIVFDGIIYLSQ